MRKVRCVFCVVVCRPSERKEEKEVPSRKTRARSHTSALAHPQKRSTPTWPFTPRAPQPHIHTTRLSAIMFIRGGPIGDGGLSTAAASGAAATVAAAALALAGRGGAAALSSRTRSVALAFSSMGTKGRLRPAVASPVRRRRVLIL